MWGLSCWLYWCGGGCVVVCIGGCGGYEVGYVVVVVLLVWLCCGVGYVVGCVNVLV